MEGPFKGQECVEEGTLGLFSEVLGLPGDTSPKGPTYPNMEYMYGSYTRNGNVVVVALGVYSVFGYLDPLGS